MNLTSRQKIKLGDKWGCPALYRNKDNVPWEDVYPEWIGKRVAWFDNKISFIRLIEEKNDSTATKITSTDLTA